MNREDLIKLSFLIVLTLIVAFPITFAMSGQDSHIMRYTRLDGSVRHVHDFDGKLEIRQDGETVFSDEYRKADINKDEAIRFYCHNKRNKTFADKLVC